MPLEIPVAIALLAALIIYAVLAGADFGGGAWDLLATGPRADKQRKLIASAIGPIWEANHVWLILVIVILFTAFPPAFAAIMTGLHIPLTIMLLGIVFRGTTFVFRAYDVQTEDVYRLWSRGFAVASVVTPIMLGVCIGALASDRVLDADGVARDIIGPWLAPFPFAVGLWTLSIFAYLAAVFLTVETNDPALQDDFRRRAILANLVAGFFAIVLFGLGSTVDAYIARRLIGSWIGWTLLGGTALAAAGAFYTLWRRQFVLARTFAVAQVVLVLTGWGAAQFPYLVPPSISIHTAKGPNSTLTFLLIALVLGMIVLFPSLYYLFKVFKGESAFALSGKVEAPPESGH